MKIRHPMNLRRLVASRLFENTCVLIFAAYARVYRKISQKSAQCSFNTVHLAASRLFENLLVLRTREVLHLHATEGL